MFVILHDEVNFHALEVLIHGLEDEGVPGGTQAQVLPEVGHVVHHERDRYCWL